MHGVIFNLLEEAVTSRWGEGTWGALLDAGGLDGSFTPSGTYPDEHFIALLEAAATQTGETILDLVRWLGRASMPHRARRHREFFADHDDVGSFLLTLNTVHAALRQRYPGAGPPAFSFDPPQERAGQGRVRVEYRSDRRMCPLAEGLIEGAAEHFDQTVTIEQPECMLRGDDRCLLETTYRPVAQRRHADTEGRGLHESVAARLTPTLGRVSGPRP